MYLSKIKKMSLALCLTLLPLSVLAAGLGQLNVDSGIGEPLKAEIDLLSVTASERASLSARIAPTAVYQSQGIERPASHSDIKIRITKGAGGKDVLKLSSHQPMSEPFLDMLVEVEWETGRLLREYTVLLDPPGYNRDVSTSQVQTPTIKTVDKEPSKPVVPIKKSTPIKNTAQASSSQLSENGPAEDYLTRKGDTLSRIARRMKPEGISLDQMLVGLYEANPEAFDGKNMNRLKVGKILQTPTEEALDAISRKEAKKEIKVQTANWKDYRNKLAGVVAASAPEESETETQSASGKVRSSAEDQSIPDSTGPKDVVKLSSGDSKAQADMQAKITALQEEVSAREKGLMEAQERTTALEKQIEDMQKLLTLRSDALSQEQATQSEVVAEPIEKAEVTQPVQASEDEEQMTSVTPAKPAKPVAKPKEAEVPAEQPSFIASILNSFSGVFGNVNTSFLAVGAGLIALVTAAWFYLRSKRRKNLADFEQGIMTSGGLKANTVFGNTSGTSVDTGDTSFLTNFSQSTSGGMIDTNDVDPIAEAEVYMAYGRDAQAEEILKDAISKEPKRYELHLKLLEMYAASKDMSAFETVSGELYTTLGADDPTWAKVAEIGIKLEPNNPLYQAKSGVGTTEGNEDDVQAGSGAQEESAAGNTDGELDASDFSDSPLADEADLDFSLNEDSQSEAKAEDSEGSPAVAAKEASEEINIDETVLDMPNVSEVLETESSSLDFDMNTSDNEQAPTTETVAEEANFTNTMPNLDFPSVDGDESKDDDVALQQASDAVVLPEIEVPSDLTLDMPEAEDASESIVLDIPDETPTENLDLDGIATLTEDTITLDDSGSLDEPADDAAQENILDMSDISLEVNDDVNNAIAEATPEVEQEQVSTEAESEEVETKLELVAAYIDMEDKEGAKELLDEVLKEGGANQRKRAEELLATLS